MLLRHHHEHHGGSSTSDKHRLVEQLNLTALFAVPARPRHTAAARALIAAGDVFGLLERVQVTSTPFAPTARCKAVSN